MRGIHKGAGLLSAVMLVSFAFCTTAVSAREETRPRRMKIGVVDVRKVYLSYDRRATFEAGLDTMQANLQEQLAERTAALQKLRDEIEQFEAGSEERREREREGRRMIAELQKFHQAAMKLRNDRIAEITKDLYGDISEVIMEYGKEHDYDLILKMDILEEKLYDQMELLLRINQQIVLYHRDSLDLTEEILARVNGKYHTEEAEKAKAEESAPAAEKPEQEEKKEEAK